MHFLVLIHGRSIVWRRCKWYLIRVCLPTTTIVGSKELDEGVRVTKEVMGWFEEANNDGKEEEPWFGHESSGKIRMLGSWMGWKAYVDERPRRGNKAWWMTKKKLAGTRLSKKLQARIVDACVVSMLLFDCHIRTWRVGEIKREM